MSIKIISFDFEVLFCEGVVYSTHSLRYSSLSSSRILKKDKDDIIFETLGEDISSFTLLKLKTLTLNCLNTGCKYKIKGLKDLGDGDLSYDCIFFTNPLR